MQCNAVSCRVVCRRRARFEEVGEHRLSVRGVNGKERAAMGKATNNYQKKKKLGHEMRARTKEEKAVIRHG